MAGVVLTREQLIAGVDKHKVANISARFCKILHGLNGILSGAGKLIHEGT
jgi:hypothetical protein